MRGKAPAWQNPLPSSIHTLYTGESFGRSRYGDASACQNDWYVCLALEARQPSLGWPENCTLRLTFNGGAIGDPPISGRAPSLASCCDAHRVGKPNAAASAGVGGLQYAVPAPTIIGGVVGDGGGACVSGLKSHQFAAIAIVHGGKASC